MTTWVQLLADIRQDLKDTSSTPRWTSEALLVWTKDAIRDYSLYFPQMLPRVKLTLDGGSYTLPLGFIHDVTVECPKDSYLQRHAGIPGVRFFSAGQKPARYHIAGGRLFLNSASQDDVLLTYQALHVLPQSTTDSTTALTVPELDHELIRLYVKAKANEQIRGQQANLDRFKLGSGDRSDNPLEPEVGNLMDEYRKKLAERIPGGAILFYRPGRGR